MRWGSPAPSPAAWSLARPATTSSWSWPPPPVGHPRAGRPEILDRLPRTFPNTTAFRLMAAGAVAVYGVGLAFAMTSLKANPSRPPFPPLALRDRQAQPSGDATPANPAPTPLKTSDGGPTPPPPATAAAKVEVAPPKPPDPAPALAVALPPAPRADADAPPTAQAAVVRRPRWPGRPGGGLPVRRGSEWLRSTSPAATSRPTCTSSRPHPFGRRGRGRFRRPRDATRLDQAGLRPREAFPDLLPGRGDNPLAGRVELPPPGELRRVRQRPPLRV